MSQREYAKGGLLPTDGRVAPVANLAPDECFVRIPDDDEATWAPCVRRDPAHEALCPGGMTVPSRRAVFGLLRLRSECSQDDVTEAVAALDAMGNLDWDPLTLTGNDRETIHIDADEVLLRFAHSDVRDAWVRLRERAGFWYS